MKIAVFGKPGSGKSTLSQILAESLALPLYCLDNVEYDETGNRLQGSQIIEKHAELLNQPNWLIEGLGPLQSFQHRLEQADVLIYLDLPYSTCYWLVTKRLLTGVVSHPKGWPKGSSIIKGSLASYRYLKMSPQFWDQAFIEKLNSYKAQKSVYVINSLKQLRQFSLVEPKE